IDEQFVDVAVGIATSGVQVSDLNTLSGDGALGVNSPSFAKDAQFRRSHIGQRLMAVQNATTTSGKLSFIMDSLATKILMCTGTTSKLPTAYGVTVAVNAPLPVSSRFKGKTLTKMANVTAKYEVIVSAGVFQSPQLVSLSGIGDKTHLTNVGITPVVNLPGVGSNLQDHDEITVVWKMNANYSIWEGCYLLSDPTKDACLAYWQTGKLNLYSFGPIFSAITAKASPSLAAPNMLTYWAPARFIGFFRGKVTRVISVEAG
ncbi:GMC oxidoreductase-domain-containing protein, partial [Collybia nuda]